MNDIKKEIDLDKINNELVNWENAPSLDDLKKDFEAAEIEHAVQVTQIEKWIEILEGKQSLKIKQGRSKIVPKLVRKQAEWRYSSLAEPFLSTEDLFMTSPRTFEDSDKAKQNGLILNYQFNNKINKVKFIDDLIHTLVDEGTAIIKVGWEFEEDNRKVYTDIVTQQTVIDPQTGQPTVQQVVNGQKESIKKVITKNQPTLEICDYRNVVVDPTCNGDLEKARFIIFSVETSLAELKKDGRYKNLEEIDLNASSILAEEDTAISKDNPSNNFKFQDNARKRIVAREYWGYWDINGDDILEPIIATWVGNTLIRLEKNPFPDKKLPFVSIQYLPIKNSIYGEPDAALLEDNQKIIGAVTRGIIDIIGRSANGQMGIRKDALDFVNARKFEQGDDYKFNSNIDPRQAFHMETYPEIPRSAMEVITLQNNEAEALTGIKAFTNGISGNALGNTATGIRSALDATSKRELSILRRIANGISQAGRKIISMNAEFLEDKEIIRITNEELVTIDRNDLGGEYDIKLKIATAESDEQKAQELSFMLQTMGNNLPFEMSQLVLANIATLRKMPDLAKAIQSYKPQPDPLLQAKSQLEIELLKAQVYNEQAKAQENAVDTQLKSAKTVTEQAKARHLNSDADIKDLSFVEQESGVNRAHEERLLNTKHQQELENKEHDRLTDLDKEAFKAFNNESI